MGRGRRPARLLRGGAQLWTVDVQLGEAIVVLVGLGRDVATARAAVQDAVTGMSVIDVEGLAGRERVARSQLHERGQPDWPTLAAAMELDAAIWSDDRDLFGVGVPVWSTWTLDRHPILMGTMNA